MNKDIRDGCKSNSWVYSKWIHWVLLGAAVITGIVIGAGCYFVYGVIKSF